MGHDDGLSRRSLLAGAGAAALAVVAGAWARGRDAVEQPIRAVRQRLAKATRPLPALPADPAATVPGLSTFLTPAKDFYRIDVADPMPMPSTEAWTLTIDGMVEQPMVLTYDQLLQREIIEVDATLSCVSNWVGGTLVGNARWTGVRLDDLIREARPEARADQVMGHSVDDFTAGFPVSVLDGRDAIVAIGMNGAVLPVEHGYPARLLVPGLYGYVSAVKWVSRIELTRFDEKVGYWVPRGWAQLAPIKLMSRIDTPRDESSHPAGQLAVAGVAWSGIHGISAVQVRVDDGPWLTAELGPSPADTTWRQWWLAWEATAGKHRIAVRATDARGIVQSAREVPSIPNGAEGLHSIEVTVT